MSPAHGAERLMQGQLPATTVTTEMGIGCRDDLHNEAALSNSRGHIIFKSGAL